MTRRLAVMSVLAASLATPALSDEVVVFAAAALKNALDAVAADFKLETGHSVTISYAGSNVLAKQIILGAPADIYISSAANWMDEVEKAGLVVPDMRSDLLGNSLVLIAHGKEAEPVEIGSDFDLAALLGDGKLAMAMVGSVPAGLYGKEALTNLGLWNEVEGSIAQSDNVRAALALVSAGEAPYGIVYASDAIASDNVTLVGYFPSDSHNPIIISAALLTGAADPADTAFFKALSAEAARARFTEHGFAVLN